MRAVTLADAWQIYQAEQCPLLAVQTRSCYRSAMRRALEFLPARPTAADVAAWHRVTMPRRFSVVYSNLCLAVLQTVVRRTAMLSGDAELGRAVLCELPLREPIKAPRCPPLDCYERACTAAKNPAEGAWLGLCFLGGLRKGELMGLRPEDWNPGMCVMSVTRQRESATRKNRRPHSVRVLDAGLVRAIEWTIAHRAHCRPRNGWHKGRSDGFLFPWGEKAIDGLLTRVREVFGADVGRYLPHGVAWHAGRHWGASLLASRGASPVEIQRWLGDSDPEIAMSYVAQVRGATDAVSLTAPASLCEWSQIAPARRSNAGQVLNPSLSSTYTDTRIVLEWGTTEEKHSHESESPLSLVGRAT